MAGHRVDIVGMKRWGVTAGVFALFALFALCSSYPLVRHFASAIPGPPADNMDFLWRIAWVSRAVFNPGFSLLHTDMLYYPFGYDLTLGPVTLAQIALALPLTVFGGEIISYNTISLLSLAVAAFGAYLLTFHLTGNRRAGVAAGVAFGFCPALVDLMAVGHFNLLGIAWLPYTLLALEQIMSGRGKRWGVIAGLFCGLIVFSDWYNVPILGVVLLVYSLCQMRRWRASLREPRRVAGLLTFAGIMLLWAALALALTRPLWQGGVQSAAYSLAYVDYMSPSLDYFFVPRVLRTLVGQPPVSEDVYNTSLSVYAGFLSLVLAGIGITTRKDSRARGFAWLGLTSLLLALGPRLRWDGRPVLIAVPAQVERAFTAGMRFLTTRLALAPMPSYYGLRVPGKIYLPLPTLALQLFVPFMSKMRFWGRFSVGAGFAVAILAGMGAAYLETRLVRMLHRRRLMLAQGGRRLVLTGVSVAVAAGLFVEFAILPYHIGYSEVRPQTVDTWLAQSQTDGPVAVFPYAQQGGAGPMVYRTLLHGKPICSGSPPFAPEGHRAAVPLLFAFPSAESIALLESWGVRYVLVGARSYGAEWEQTQQAIAAQPDLGLATILDDEPVYHDVGLWNCVPGYDRTWVVDQIWVYELARAR